MIVVVVAAEVVADFAVADNDEELSLCDVLSTRTNQPTKTTINHSH